MNSTYDKRYLFSPTPLSWSNYRLNDCTLDVILRKVLKHKIPPFVPEGSSTVIRFNYLEFTVHSHSTGCAVTGCIMHPDGERFQFFNVTFWYSNTYTFNTGYHVPGPWDEEMKKMRIVFIEAIQKYEEEVEIAIKERETKEFAAFDEKVKSFTALFDKK